jgi:RimJ/RimL family protein N-acetyltransferase
MPEAVIAETRRRAAQMTSRASSHIASNDVGTQDGIREFGVVHPPIQDVHGRFIIREFRATDLDRLREMNGDLFFAPLRHKYGPIVYLNNALRQRTQGKSRKGYTLAIEDTQTRELIGSVMLYDFKSEPRKGGASLRQAEVAYFVDPTYQNINIGTDASIRMLFHLGNALGLDQMVASAHPSNEPSRRLLATLGFKKVGHEAASQYKEDPAKSESYERDEKGHYAKDAKGDFMLKHAPRDLFAVTFDHFLQQKDKIVTPEKDVAAIDNARAKRKLVRQQREKKVKISPRLPDYTPQSATGKSTPHVR